MLWLMLYELHVQMAIWKVPGLCWWLEGGNFCCQSIQVSISIRQCRMGHTTWRTISLVDQPKCEIQLGFQTWSLRFSFDPSAANILWRSPRQLPSICRSMRRIFLPKRTKVHLFCFHKRSWYLLIAAAHLNISPWSSPPRPTAASWPNMPVLDDSRPERICRNSSIPSCTSSRETNTANTNSINLRLEQSIQHQIYALAVNTTWCQGICQIHTNSCITGNVGFKSFTLPLARGDQELLSLLSSLSASCAENNLPPEKRWNPWPLK